MTKLIPYDAHILPLDGDNLSNQYWGRLTHGPRTYQPAKETIPSQYERPITDLALNSSAMTVDTYRLILLPCIPTYRVENETYQ